QLLEVGTRLHGRGLAGTAVQAGVEPGEAQTTVVGEEHRCAARLGPGVLNLQVGTASGLQRDVGAADAVVVAGAVLVDVGGADGDVVAEPVPSAEARGDVARVEAAGDVLVVDQQQLRVAVQRHVAGQGRHVLAGDLGQRA